MHTDTIPAPPPTTEIVTETVMVTPEMAKTWLERNLVHRPLIPRNLDALVWDLRNGKWKITHQGIAFNRDLLLVDGQHRLNAVVVSGIAAPIRVTYNLDCEYAAPIDAGCMRKVHHVLGMTHRRVAVCNAMSLLETGSAPRSTASRVTDVYTRHERGISWALDAFPVQRRLNANVLAACAFAYPVAPDLVDDFANRLTTGANIEEGSAVLTLRRHLDRIEGFTSRTRAQIALVTASLSPGILRARGARQGLRERHRPRVLREAPRGDGTVSAAAASSDAAEGGVVLSLRDEAELRAYFALELPPPPGARSPFGAMCDRLASGRNPKTKELPSAGASWTEIVECGWSNLSTHDGEDAFIAYVDARRFVKRVEARLARLTAFEGEVLRAHYTERDVSTLTPTAMRENRERAARGRHETIDETVASVRRESGETRAPKAPPVRTKMSKIRREAAESLENARTKYGRE